MRTEEVKPILVVDDDPQMRLALREAIQRLGHRVTVCEAASDALAKLQQAGFSLVVTDMKMPKMDGLKFLKEVRRRIGNLPVLVITGFGTIENAVETMKEGATDYLMKPFSFDTLEKAIDSIMARSRYEKGILTANLEMQKIVVLAANLAGSDITVLIQGESGTGKELLARYIHRMSRRAEKPFIAVNCAAIPDNLLESELFGHEKGAFTGATDRKKGRFELADGGTLLLDEIGEMSIMLQAKLLRVLQEREIDRVGGKETVPVDVRVIATTNRDLYNECMEGRFREDLYYRLNVFPIKVPPLRERPDDIIFLASHFVEKFSVFAGRDPKNFSDEAIDLLMNGYWRGNIRELENVIQRAVFLSSGEVIEARDLMLDNVGSAARTAVNGKIRDMEKELIMQTLKDVDGNKTKAAKILGVSVRTIRNKLHEYGQKFPTG
ncbi:MAG TPA: sigma-54 dependent transcriptional regulator [Thermodesulfovibrionales bacterium]|nr:sigma-54 dependent transcriptional regulator [Thermodesulfovibrionales bacterium]